MTTHADTSSLGEELFYKTNNLFPPKKSFREVKENEKSDIPWF